MNRSNVSGFTLIELLIVVAIIAILAAIAVPNFLEAQTRSKVSRIKADQRSVATALESYAVDYRKYPIDHMTTMNSQAMLGYAIPYPQGPLTKANSYCVRYALRSITTPTAYMTDLPGTSFDAKGSAHSNGKSFPYDFKNHGSEYSCSDYLGTDPLVYAGFPYFCYPENGYTRDKKWRLRDVGPDLWQNNQVDPSEPYYGWQYDPTNGTVSSGDIVRWGP